MRYRGTLTIPANTPKATPATQVVPLTFGRILETCVLYPPGPAGLAHFVVLYHERQILPASPDEDFIGDGETTIIPERFPVFDEPFEVTLVGWSPGSTYEHKVYVDFTVEADQQLATLYPASVALPGA
jgi:hypothetical protein